VGPGKGGLLCGRLINNPLLDAGSDSWPMYSAADRKRAREEEPSLSSPPPKRPFYMREPPRAVIVFTTRISEGPMCQT
jgi:hypothetical protein